MSVNPNELYTIGQTLFTSIGIAKIKDYYVENDLKKVRFALHKVNCSDSVTPNGEVMTMSTPDIKLKQWEKDFSTDIEFKKKALITRGTAEDLKTVEIINQALANGPCID